MARIPAAFIIRRENKKACVSVDEYLNLGLIRRLSLILYGIPSCASCKEACKALEAADYQVTFRDVRSDPLSQSEWTNLLGKFGTTLINKKSATYRGLSMLLREAEAEIQLLSHPTLMKRPVLKDGDRFTIGWSADVQAVWLD